MDEVKTFNTWYNEYDRIVYSNILKIVKDPNHVEDILQDVFVALWQNRQLFSSGRSVAGWLVIVSYNKSISFLRAEGRNKLIYIDDYQLFDLNVSEDLYEEALYQRQLDMIESALESLPRHKKETFRLSRIEGKSINKPLCDPNRCSTLIFINFDRCSACLKSTKLFK